jgi:hypothetical protein
MAWGSSVISVEFPLEKTERRLWSGAQIDRGRRITASNVVGAIVTILIVGAMFSGILDSDSSGVLENGVELTTETIVMVVAGLLIGAAVAVAGPLRPLLRRRLFYCITSERVMILRGSRIQTIYLVELHNVLLKEAGDGSGTIVIGDDLEGLRDRHGKPRVILAPRIADVPDVREVYRTLEDARAIAHKDGKPKPSA